VSRAAGVPCRAVLGVTNARNVEQFTGGAPQLFEAAGREQLAVLLDHGLTSKSKVADLGCGALRGGRWVIPVLEPFGYCGVEPFREKVERGLRDFVNPDLVRLLRPRFSYNADFSLDDFSETFTHVILRSVWTHSTREQIQQSLDAFVEHSTADAVMLTSVVPISYLPFHWYPDYRGSTWVAPDVVAHRYGWLRAACRERRLEIARVHRKRLGGQRWLRITWK